MTGPRFRWRVTEGKYEEFLIPQRDVAIGRNSEADLVLERRHASRRHAKLISGSSGYEIIDLGSTYGTLVNDERITRAVLKHGDRVVFGKDDIEFVFLAENSVSPPDPAASGTVQGSLTDLGKALPSAASDLEKIRCVLDFQYQWNQVFTPENALTQILESALSISGAERAFIMTPNEEGFGYSAGLNNNGRKLLESDFRTSRSIVRETAARVRPVFMVEGIQDAFAGQASIVGMNLKAIACLPLMGIPADRDSPEILGILYLDSTKVMHSLSGLDEKILERLAVEAGNVLERVERIKSIERRKMEERDLILAEEMQRSLLPRHHPKLRDYQLVAFSNPTRYVGGDFYDFHATPAGDLVAALADISGKGVAASVMSSMLLGCLQLLVQDGGALPSILNRLNRFLLDKSSGKFATMFLFTANSLGTGEYISAGHNPAYLYRSSTGQIEELPSNNLILGVFDFVSYQSSPLELQPRDVLLIYSDGLTDAENALGEMFGEERVKAILRQEAARGAQALLDSLLGSVRQFTQGQDQTDDITLVVTERNERPETGGRD